MKKIAIFLIVFLTSSCVEIALLSSVKTQILPPEEKSLTNSGKDLMIETRLIQN